MLKWCILGSIWEIIQGSTAEKVEFVQFEYWESKKECAWMHGEVWDGKGLRISPGNETLTLMR